MDVIGDHMEFRPCLGWAYRAGSSFRMLRNRATTGNTGSIRDQIQASTFHGPTLRTPHPDEPTTTSRSSRVPDHLLEAVPELILVGWAAAATRRDSW